MPRLVTQMTTDRPAALVVCDAVWFRSTLQSLLHSADFEPKIISSAQFSQESATLLRHEWYKIIVVTDWTSSLTTASPRKLLDQINFHPRTTWIGVVPSLLETADTTELGTFWLIHSHKIRQEIQNIKQNFGGSSIVIHNVVVPESDTWWPLRYSLQQLPKLVLLDPSVSLPLVSLEKVRPHLKKLLFSPRTGEQSLVQGSYFASRDMTLELQRQYLQYYQRKLVIKTSHLELGETAWADFTPYSVSQEQLPQLVESAVRLFPSPDELTRVSEQLRQSGLEKEHKSLPKPKLPKTVSRHDEESYAPRDIAIPALAIPQIEAAALNTFKRALQQIAAEVPVKKKSQPKVTSVSGMAAATSAKIQEPSQELESKLQSIFSVSRADQKFDHVTTVAKDTINIKRTNKKRTGFFYAGLTLVGAAVGMIVLASLFWMSQWWLATLLLQPADQLVDQRQNRSLPLATKLLAIQTEAYGVVLPAPLLDEALSLVSVSQDLQVVLAEMKSIQAEQIDQVLTLLTATPRSIVDSENVSPQELYERLSRITSQLEGFAEAQTTSSERTNLEDFTSHLQKRRTQLITYQQLQPLLVSLLAKEGRRTYALVFQNEQELRASGGFIQAVALITLDQGMIIDSQVISSYKLDESLAGQVTPPEDLRQFLGETNLYLRDSNWSPHFPAAATQMRWFIEHESNKKIDGILAVNGLVLKEILREVGPLELPQYNELLTDKNIGERMEFHSEVTLVDNNKSSDYSVVLLDALLKKLQTITADKVPSLLKALNTSLQTKQLLVTVFDPEEQATLTTLGWTGDLVTPACPAQFSSSTCQVDTLAVIDSNIGVNKANYHTTRQETHEVSVQQDGVQHTHRVTFNNTAHSNAWPKGSYNSYLRFVVPQNAVIKDVKVNDQPVAAKDAFAQDLPEIQKKIIGLLSSTPIQKQTTVTLVYQIPQVVSSDDFAYAFFFQKQSGVEKTLQALSVTFPPSLKPTLIAPQADVSGNKITFSNLEDSHVFVGIKF